MGKFRKVWKLTYEIQNMNICFVPYSAIFAKVGWPSESDIIACAIGSFLPYISAGTSCLLLPVFVKLSYLVCFIYFVHYQGVKQLQCFDKNIFLVISFNSCKFGWQIRCWISLIADRREELEENMPPHNNEKKTSAPENEKTL